MSESLSLAVVTAGLSQSSSTRLLADRAAEATVKAARERGWDVETVYIDVRQLAAEVTTALTSGLLGEGLTQAAAVLAESDGLVVGTPVFNAGPSGLFTSFFQAIDDDLLIAKPVMLTATAASARHSLVVDDQMRPMFAYLRSLAIPTSLFAAAEDWNDRDLSTRIERAATELALLMGSGFSREVRQSTWGSYRHEFGSVALSDGDLDFDSDLMRLAAGGSLDPLEPDEDEPPPVDEGKGGSRPQG
jgi:FMN reductase